ncbi:uncharacterized protein [Gossypium hirsutum]|uniref:Reverse transcriptase n=1 Tax=Gossypium hirsutum TaxID=3635 RepID=A0A1U8MIK6_GOSHI|nr:uncharacterized protein LOC107937106 [Gossypium hirsutum]
METKLNDVRMERLRKRCNFQNGIDSSANSSRGGLSLAWNGNDVVQVYSYSSNHIDVEINEIENSKIWHFTDFYGNPNQSSRQESWNLLRHLNSSHSMPWCVCGDFNEIMYAHEKNGGAVRTERQMEKFRKVLEECELLDMGYRGQKFTWKRGNFAETNIRERLDRGVAKREWLNLFPNFLLQHLPHSFSDHCPITIQTMPNVPRYRVIPFKFKSWWITEPSCEEVIQKLWQEKIGNAFDKLEHTRDGLQKWGKNIKRERIKRSTFLIERLRELEEMDRDGEIITEMIDVKL